MFLQQEKMQLNKFLADYVPYTRKDVKSVLETLCRNQYIDPVGPTITAACETLASANIARPVCDLSGRFEFHSFQMEVAIRGVFDLPATLKQAREPKDWEPESTGRGSIETLNALKPVVHNFETKKNIETALGIIGSKST